MPVYKRMKERSTIETKRLLLRSFELSDAKDVQRLAGDRAIADTTLNIPHPYEDGMAEEWISVHRLKFEAGELSNFAIVLRTSGYVKRWDRFEDLQLYGILRKQWIRNTA